MKNQELHPRELESLAPLMEQLKGREEVVCAYVFGSVAQGTPGPLSDVDVAVLLDEEKVPVTCFFDERLELIGMVMTALKTPEVDVIILNEASLPLAFQVLAHGHLLIERDHCRRVTYEGKVLNCYLDIQPHTRTYRHYLIQQIQTGTFGG